MRSGLLCWILLSACSGEATDTDDPVEIPRVPTDADTDTDTDADADADTDTDTDTPDTPDETDTPVETGTPPDTDTGTPVETGTPPDTDTGTPIETGTPVDTSTPVDTGTPPAPTCNLDGAYDPALEGCDDANACDLDGCAATSCDREDSVALTTMALVAGLGFDLDDADGDGNPHTGVDNLLGSDALVNSVLNPMLDDAFIDGSIRLAMSFDADDPGDDPDIAVSMHAFVDPACAANPVYGPGAPPPWIDAPPAEVYSDSGQFAACEPPARFDDASDPGNGIHPVAAPGQPPAPVLVAAGESLTLDAGALGALGFTKPRIEATVGHDGATLKELANGVLGGTVAPGVLFRMPGSDASLCPTALHAVIGLIGQPDIDVDGTGLDFVDANVGAFFPCLLTSVTIDGCFDAETGVLIPDTAVDGDCALDPAMTDGYSAGASFSASELHIVEQVDGAAYCP